MNESANEHSPKVQHECDERNEERVQMKVEAQIQPVKHVPINYFFKT